MRKKEDLYPHQKLAIEYILKKDIPKALLLLGLGMGKTATNLTVFKELYDDFAISKCLVIAPLRVCNNVWKQECEEWEHLKDINIVIATGSADQRRKTINSDHQICVINRENLDWLINYNMWQWDMVIVDESSSFKNHTSKRFKAIKKILHRVKVMIPSTGTPSPKGLINLWSQVFLIDQGERLGRTITCYRQKYFTQKPHNLYDYYPRDDNAINDVLDKIKDITISMDRDFNDKPIISDQIVELPTNVSKEVKKFIRELIFKTNEGSDISAPNSAVVGNKIIQLCNGAVYDSERKVHKIHDEKLKALKDIIEENDDENFLVAYNYKHDLDRIKEVIPSAVVMGKTDKEIKLWNEGKIKVMLIHPASGGHGLNLQHGGNNIIWFGLNWDLELYQQLNGRLNRPGQKKIVKIIHLICKEEKVLQALKNKEKLQNSVLDYLKY